MAVVRWVAGGVLAACAAGLAACLPGWEGGDDDSAPDDDATAGDDDAADDDASADDDAADDDAVPDDDAGDDDLAPDDDSVPDGSWGGPDAYGYTWYSSDHPDGPEYGSVYESIVTHLTEGGDDDGWWVQDLGFAFPFYGVDYTTVSVATNGMLAFGEWDLPGRENARLAEVEGPLVAVFWDDLMEAVDGGDGEYDFDYDLYFGWYGLPDVEALAVEWREIDHWDAPDDGNAATFRVLLHRDGRIVVEYADLTWGDSDSDHGVGATVGITSGRPGEVLELSHDEAFLAEGMAFEFRPPGS